MRIKQLKKRMLFGLIVLSLGQQAQNGMDYAIGVGAIRYSRLRTGGFPPFSVPVNSEKALGVFQANITPQSFLEVNSTPAYMPFPMPGIGLGELFRTNGPATNLNAWRMFTGAGANAEKFSITVPANSNNAEISTMQNGFIHFNTNGLANPGGLRRVTIFDETFNAVNTASTSGTPFGGGVAINLNPALPITQPFSLLHIGENTSPGLGHRSWMNVGTFYGQSTDNMYVGIKTESSTVVPIDRADAVINWGDNTNVGGGPNQFGPDYLRFIFTAPLNIAGYNAFASGQNGQEMMRISSIFGNVGIGNFFDDPLFPIPDPFRRLEILSNKATQGVVGDPQFRLTHTQQTPTLLTTTGIYTDFHTTDRGDLGITTYSNPAVNTPSLILQERFVGINTNLPGNSLEINSQFVNSAIANNQPTTSLGAPTGWAGLRFSDLNATSIPQANPGLGILAVDSLGDVIYVPTDTTNFGNLCTATLNPNPLTGDFQIPTGTFQYKFYGQGLIDNVIKRDIVAVGYSCGINPPSRFSVLESQTVQPTVQTYAGHFNNNNTSSPIFTGIPIETAGLYAEAKRNILGPPNYLNHNIGAIGEATGSINSIGMIGRIAKSSLPIITLGQGRYAIGGAFMSDTSVTNIPSPSVENYGVFATAFNSPANNYGVYAEVDGSSGIGGHYAIFAKTTGLNPNFPALGGNYAGYFDGDVVTTGSDNFSSDAVLKQNFDSIPNALNIINQLKPKTFDYKLSQYPQMSLPSGLQYGLVAQDVYTVLPAIVNAAKHPQKVVNNTNYPAFTYSTVEYQQIIPILVRAVQQLSAQNQKLDSLITALTQTVSSCCSNSAAKQTGINGNDPNALSQINVNLSDIDMIVLDQNKPNPFAEQTTITYNVPEKYGFAQLVFKTIDGKIIKTVDITKKGLGQVNVFANDLSNGLYMYSLIVDGKTVDTKKMVKQN
ncbi:MAG: tail fiber domain-containing protein [Bacteroidia bacterium]|nr:tail fiber domain-containing protein [Bacteroidia bacterium]